MQDHLGTGSVRQQEVLGADTSSAGLSLGLHIQFWG